MSNANVDLVISYYEAYNRRDFDAYDEIFADHVAFQSVGGVSGNGVDTVKFFDRIWVTAASDWTVEGIYHLGDGDRVVCHNRVTGNHDGTLLMPDGSEVPATGQQMDATYFASFEGRNRKIVSKHIYFDRMILAEELHLLPVPTT
jgi:ketosteroid isomerase-like protein